MLLGCIGVSCSWPRLFGLAWTLKELNIIALRLLNKGHDFGDSGGAGGSTEVQVVLRSGGSGGSTM